MPKRNRTKEQRAVYGATPLSGAGATPAPADTELARAAKLFAASVRDHAAADQAVRDQRTAELARNDMHASLLATKESAAALIRQLRADGRPRQKLAEAEAAYRTALAELTEFETGERPHWAPAVPEPPEAVLVDVESEAEPAEPE